MSETDRTTADRPGTRRNIPPPARRRRRWRWIALIAAVAPALILTWNTQAVSHETAAAHVTVPDGRILNLTHGDVQITDSGPPPSPSGAAARPIVLLHCYSCSLRWFSRILPILTPRHRVIRIDLLGHGGSEKPTSGYDIPNQADVVIAVLDELEVTDAIVAGNSMGAMVAAAVAEQSPADVAGVVIIDMAPRIEGFGPGLPALAHLTYTPVLGQALWRVKPEFLLRRSVSVAFSPGYDTADGFDDPNTPVEDLRTMTYTSFDAAHESNEYLQKETLADRLRAIAKPTLVIFGANDQLLDANKSVAAYRIVPGLRSRVIEGAGHAPQVEKPDQTAETILDFADEVARE